MTLTEFLLARIASDDAWARREGALRGFHDGVPGPGRLLADCEAKRRILDACVGAGFRVQRDDVLRALALPYADHPDCLPEWKP